MCWAIAQAADCCAVRRTAQLQTKFALFKAVQAPKGAQSVMFQCDGATAGCTTLLLTKTGKWHPTSLAEVLAVESDFVLDARALTSGALQLTVHSAACERTHHHLTLRPVVSGTTCCTQAWHCSVKLSQIPPHAAGLTLCMRLSAARHSLHVGHENSTVTTPCCSPLQHVSG